MGPGHTADPEETAASASSSSDQILRDIARIDDAPPPADLVGTRLGRFQVAALLGRGGMGVVYRARDEALRRDVALKVLPPRFADDEARRRRFLREARSAAAVNHPCIATVHEVGEAEGRVYIAMELVRGRTLAAVLAEQRLPVPEALRIAGRILEGVGKAHEAGLVHRDLKPDNVMLTDDGALKVLDFGLAKPQEPATPEGPEGAPALAGTLSHGTTHGRIVGTPRYMSPEQARGEPVDPRSDVFSFGVMLYEMLTGRRPFVGRTAADVMTAIQRDEPAPASELNPEVSPELSRIVQRCLAKEAGERYGDCRSLAGDLDRAGVETVEATARRHPRAAGVPSERRVPRMIGELVDGRYRILRALGVGGMGAVYEAEHTGTGRRVAIKVIHAQKAERIETVARFHREARAAGSIETPHIVQVFDTGTDPATGVVYMVMELLRGEDVQHLLARLGKLPPTLALRLVGQACLGLRKAHEAGVVHRDVKPANLFLSTQGSGEVILKVVDFGIAKMMDPTPEDTTLTGPGGILGSPRYMSPEQVMGSRSIDHRTDVWSLGVMLYQALAGQVPHAESEAKGELMVAICSEPAPPIQGRAPWVPPEVAQIVHRMIARSRDARFPSMAAVLEALEPCVPGGLAIHARDLVGLAEAEQMHVAPRTAVERETVPGRVGSLVPLAGGETAHNVSQGATPSPSRLRRSLLRAGIALPLVLGLGGLVVYERVPAAPQGVGPIVSAMAPSPPSAAVPAPADERTVRLAVEPADAAVEVDGRATPVDDGSVELRGVLGSAHHVRLVKGSQETAGEVAITSLGAVPPRMQMEAPPPRPLLAKPSGGRADAARGPVGTSARDAGKNPALDGQFE